MTSAAPMPHHRSERVRVAGSCAVAAKAAAPPNSTSPTISAPRRRRVAQRAGRQEQRREGEGIGVDDCHCCSDWLREALGETGNPLANMDTPAMTTQRQALHRQDQGAVSGTRPVGRRPRARRSETG